MLFFYLARTPKVCKLEYLGPTSISDQTFKIGIGPNHVLDG